MGWFKVIGAFVCLFAATLSARTVDECRRSIAFPDAETIPFAADYAADFIRYQDYSASMGAIVSSIDSELHTRIYFGLSEPDVNGHLSYVDPNAREVLIYFHGSGTKKASGKNFIHKMQMLVNAGVAPIAIDLPFHSEGPIDSQLLDLDYFMDWLHRLVARLRASGKRIHMAGHSFGPWVALEYMARYPHDVEGALLVSAAAANHPALTWTYENIVEKGMRFIDVNAADSIPNVLGGEWAFQMQRQSRWERLPAPKSKIHFLRGTDDEWFPENKRLPRLLGTTQPYGARVVEDFYRKKFPQAEFSFVEGVGHYIFEVRNSEGRNLILDKMFDLMAIPVGERYGVSKTLSPRESIASLYYTNPLFRAWLGTRYRHALGSPERALNTLKDWKRVNGRLWNEIFFSIPETAPDFFAQRTVSWEKLGHEIRKAIDGKYYAEWDGDMKIFQAEYFRYLEALAKGQRLSLGADPATPALAKFDEKFRQGFVSRWGIVGSLLIGEITRVVEQHGTIQSIEPLGTQVARVTYRLGEKEPQSTCVFTGMSRENAERIVQEAFHAARRQNHWMLPADRWEGEARGFLIRGTHHQGVITTGELICPSHSD